MHGSGIGPVSHVVNSSDLKAITPGNSLCNYADDTYLIIPPANEESRIAELENVEQWSQTINLLLNRPKSLEKKKNFIYHKLIRQIIRHIAKISMEGCRKARAIGAGHP